MLLPHKFHQQEHITKQTIKKSDRIDFIQPEDKDNYSPKQRGDRMPHRNRPLHPVPIINFGVLIIGFLIIGFNSGIKFFVRWMNEQEERDEKEKQYLSAELAFLKQQVSPHFFMNTLNNIHALVDIDSDGAKDAIIRLSRLMRYLLYEADAEKIPLIKEIDFLDSYIELMRLRYNENKLSIHIDYNQQYIENVYVPSLLFLPLIENAFKHGIQSNTKSFVDIHINTEEGKLIFTIKNSYFPKKKTELNEASGIGLENIKKRLNLIYKTNYVLLINANQSTFEISIAIPV